MNQTSQRAFFQKGFASIVVILAALVASVLGYLGYNKLVKPKSISPPSQIQRNYKPVPKNSLPKPKPVSVKIRSKKPGVVQSLVVANAIDKTGRPLSYSTVYKSSVPSLGLVVKLNSTKPGTHVDYVRYINGRVLDHRHVTTVTPNLKYLVFSWPLKGVSVARPKGDYVVKTYINGIFDASTSYKVI